MLMTMHRHGVIETVFTNCVDFEIHMNCQRKTCFHKPCTHCCVFQDIEASVGRVCTWCMESKRAAIRMQQEHSSLWKFIIWLQVPVCTLQSVHSHSFPEGAASLDSVRNIWAQYLTSFMQSYTCSWMNKIYTQTYTPNTIINKNISPFGACRVRSQWMKKQLLKMIRAAKVPAKICRMSAQYVHIWMSQLSAHTFNFCSAAATQSWNSHTSSPRKKIHSSTHTSQVDNTYFLTMHCIALPCQCVNTIEVLHIVAAIIYPWPT